LKSNTSSREQAHNAFDLAREAVNCNAVLGRSSLERHSGHMAPTLPSSACPSHWLSLASAAFDQPRLTTSRLVPLERAGISLASAIAQGTPHASGLYATLDRLDRRARRVGCHSTEPRFG
jgi:hypothetical protein